MQNFFLSPGLTFMLPNSTENEFSKRGRLGLIFEGGAYHIFEKGGNVFNYLDYGVGYKRLSGSEFNDVNNKSIFSGRVKAVEIPAERAIDIDNLLDFEIAEFLMTRKVK